MRRLAKLTSILFAFIFLGMQFVPTAATPKTSATTGTHMAKMINPQVGAILDRSCQDCHSSCTTWPWYSPRRTCLVDGLQTRQRAAKCWTSPNGRVSLPRRINAC